MRKEERQLARITELEAALAAAGYVHSSQLAEVTAKLNAAEERVSELESQANVWRVIETTQRRRVFTTKRDHDEMVVLLDKLDALRGSPLEAAKPTEPWVPKVKDIVRGSQHKPKGCYDGSGVIIYVAQGGTLPITVRWDNGSECNYIASELALIEPASPSIETWAT